MRASLGFAVSAVSLIGIAAPAWAESNIDSTYKYGWSENTGWQNYRAMNGDHGVLVNPDCLRGYVWAENIGWIHLGASGASCPYGNTAANNYGVNVDGSGNCSGYAWSENVGWINFNPVGGGVQVTIATGAPPRDFDGYAWGENIGYIHFNNATPQYKVQQATVTLVELAKFTAVFSGNRVSIQWQTTAELATAGFHLHRSCSASGPWERITSGLIFGAGTSVAPTDYSHEDRNLQPGVYYYRLEDVNTNGDARFHEPVVVTVARL